MANPKLPGIPEAEQALLYAKLTLKENGLQDYVDAMNEFNYFFQIIQQYNSAQFLLTSQFYLPIFTLKSMNSKFI